MKKRKTRVTTRYVMMFGALMAVANIVLGLVMMDRSVQTVRVLVHKNMLDVASTAAALLNGNDLGALTEKDVGSPVFNELLNELTVFQTNADIEYIYAVRQVGENEFVFTVDADPEDPADFGEDVLVTDALRQASKGVAAVDTAPAEDEWGNFYSAYCPVYDDTGAIAGIVGVDFDSAWYEQKIREHSLSIGIVTALSVLVGVGLVLLFTAKIRRRFNALNAELASLSADMDELGREIAANAPGWQRQVAAPEAGDRPPEGAPAGDEIEELGIRMKALHEELKKSLDYTRSMAYTDALTGVGNSAAYLELQAGLAEEIQSHRAAFSLVVFDINSLKQVNDRNGHAQGDWVIQAAAAAISHVFGPEHTYRIGGDEFLTYTVEQDPAALEALLRKVDSAAEDWNRSSSVGTAKLSLSAGVASYQPDADRSFRDVFSRADGAMYRRKGEYHREHDNG